MFTGIIEHEGCVISNERQGAANRLVLSNPFSHLTAGESIAVNGVCLTLLPLMGDTLSFDVSPETLAVTSLGCLTSESVVNLERAMSATARFGGHYVSGHVDAKAQVVSMNWINECAKLVLGGFSEEAKRYLLPKGSISVDGVSLTINSVSGHQISLMLIPHTIQHTTLKFLNSGQLVNIEFDYLTRIIAHQLQCMATAKNEVLL